MSCINDLDYIDFKSQFSSEEIYKKIASLLNHDSYKEEGIESYLVSHEIKKELEILNIGSYLAEKCKNSSADDLERLFLYSELLGTFSVDLVEEFISGELLKYSFNCSANLYLSQTESLESRKEQSYWTLYPSVKKSEEIEPPKKAFYCQKSSTITLVEALKCDFVKQAAMPWTGVEKKQYHTVVGKVDLTDPYLIIDSTKFELQMAAVLLGTLSGIAKRAVSAAYLYSKQRQAYGRTIFHHQAITHRLADLAISRDSLFLIAHKYLSDQSGQNKRCEARAQIKIIKELSLDIAVNSVQIAGAHGYVDGLVFKELYEKAKTLNIFLSSFVEG